MPTLIDATVPGIGAYVRSMELRPTDVSRSWSYNGDLRSYQWRAGGLVKNRLSFTEHGEPDALLGLLDDATRLGVDRPSSYATFFHHVYRSPTASGPARRAMSWPVPGGWESLMQRRGDYPGPWWQYDIRSAYLWALYELGALPDPASYRFSERLDAHRNGIYLLRLDDGVDGAPYPYDRSGRWPATIRELEEYRLPLASILYGITWTRTIDTEPMIGAIMRWPWWKAVGRAYWGRWATTAPVECTTYAPDGSAAHTWHLTNIAANPIWAHLVLAAVRRRLWEVTRAARVLRVYVDNLICDRPLPVSDAIGGWRQDAHYPNGVRVTNLHQIVSLN